MECRVLKSGECEITQFANTTNHIAIDLVGKNYTLDYIVAHSDGKIIKMDDGHGNEKGTRSYGNYIIIDHYNGYQTLYAHMQRGLNHYVGEYINKGDVLGYMGDSGNAYGGHLHFEVRYNGDKINPYDYLNSNFSPFFEKTTEELAKEVIEGIYGNGEIRRAVLGDRYNEVQFLVNEMLKPKDDGLKFLVEKTIRGDFGNGSDRRRNLGADYNKIQYQVNMNYKYGTQNNVRIY